MKFTVFGSSGFIGSNLKSYLISNEHEVFCPERNFDSDDKNNLGHVIYCIGLTSDFREKPFETVEAHVCKLKVILEKCEFNSLTYLSSTRVYSHNIRSVDETSLISVSVTDPFDLFNVSKLNGELLALNCGRKNIKIARISNVYGNDFGSKNFITSIITDAVVKGKIILRTTPNSSKDYIGIVDVVNLLYQISINGKESVYNVASGNSTTNNEILQIIKNETGCLIEFSEKAENIIFPTIKINRINDEFSFEPSSHIIDTIPDIIKGLRNNLKIN